MRKAIIFSMLISLSVGWGACSVEESTFDTPKENPEGGIEDESSTVEMDEPLAIIPSGGFYIANEGTFTTDTGGGFNDGDASLNYIRENGIVDYRVYHMANSAGKLVRVTHSSTSWGGNIYFVARSGGITLTIVDAETLEKKEELLVPSGEGRAFAGISDKLGYLSCSKGIYKVNLENLTLGEAIQDVAEKEIGNMCFAGKHVFAVSPKAVYVIDVATSAVKETISGDFWTLTRSKDGDVWIAAKTEFIKVNPVTMKQERIPYPEGMAVTEDTNFGMSINTEMWSVWHAGSLCASTQSNVLYWANQVKNSKTTKTDIIRYDIDANMAKSIYTLGEVDDDGDMTQLALYRSSCMRVDPVSDNLVVVATGNGYGFAGGVNRVFLLKADGALDGEEIVLEGGNGTYNNNNAGSGYLWRPAMPLFKDINLPQILIKRILLSAERKMTIDLKEKIMDADNTSASILYEVEFPKENDLVTYTLTDDGILTITAKEKTGSVDCKLTAVSNGKRIEKTIKVDVILNK